MQYSDTSTKGGILQRIELTLGFPDGAITGDTTQLAYFTSLTNEATYNVVTEILASQDAWDFDDSNHGDYSIATAPMVAGQRDYGLPTDYKVLGIKRVDVTYDGSNYYPASHVDSSQFGQIGNTTTEDNNFSDTQPAYDLKANSMWVYPLATSAQVAAGAAIRMEYIRATDAFTTADTTQEPGIDRVWHELVPLGASMKYAAFRNMENSRSLKILYDEGIRNLRSYYSRKNRDDTTTLTTPYSVSDYS
jgi:hypothetical protein